MTWNADHIISFGEKYERLMLLIKKRKPMKLKFLFSQRSGLPQMIMDTGLLNHWHWSISIFRIIIFWKCTMVLDLVIKWNANVKYDLKMTSYFPFWFWLWFWICKILEQSNMCFNFIFFGEKVQFFLLFVSEKNCFLFLFSFFNFSISSKYISCYLVKNYPMLIKVKMKNSKYLKKFSLETSS